MFLRISVLAAAGLVAVPSICLALATQPVPEPSTAALLAALAGVGGAVRLTRSLIGRTRSRRR